MQVVAPVARFWHELQLEPPIVATYVTLSQRKPEHASVLRLATELGLTPASILRMRLVVEQPEPTGSRRLIRTGICGWRGEKPRLRGVAVAACVPAVAV